MEKIDFLSELDINDLEYNRSIMLNKHDSHDNKIIQDNQINQDFSDRQYPEEQITSLSTYSTLPNPLSNDLSKTLTNNHLPLSKSVSNPSNPTTKTTLIKKSLDEMTSTKQHGKSIISNISDTLINLKNTIKFNLISSNKQVNFNKETKITIQGQSLIKKGGNENPARNFIADSYVYITYRNGFNEIKSGGQVYSNDCGWGCMIRAAQMMLGKVIYEVKKNDLKYKNEYECKSNKNVPVQD